MQKTIIRVRSTTSELPSRNGLGIGLLQQDTSNFHKKCNEMYDPECRCHTCVDAIMCCVKSYY